MRFQGTFQYGMVIFFTLTLLISNDEKKKKSHLSDSNPYIPKHHRKITENDIVMHSNLLSEIAFPAVVLFLVFL